MGEEHTPHPGMVLGPDGKPCKVCTAFRAWNRKTTNTSSSLGVTANVKDAALTSIGIAQAIPPPEPSRSETCPPDVEQLGRATWTFLHTTAAYYPERPNPLQQRHMHSLLSSLPTLYPCSHCASHLGECMKRNPPDVSGRASLSRWLCQRHNEVNERLGKDLFDCNKTDERWKDGPPDGSCD
ncbi:FAD-dependent thiol oxidase [Gautieria morchelliformis]|nr:FAD-dependent thiol oxidase [Gautieria morchelliformis]